MRSLRLVLIAILTTFFIVACTNEHGVLPPIEPDEPISSVMDTQIVDTTGMGITAEMKEFPDEVYSYIENNLIDTTEIDKSASSHPCCLDAWGCTEDPGIPGVEPFYAWNFVTESIHKVTWADKPNEDFIGVEVAVLDANGVYIESPACDTVFYAGGVNTLFGASCYATPPVSCL